MLHISINKDTCSISHRATEYTFSRDFLTPPLWQSLRHLLPPENSYHLTQQQNTDLAALFNKINNEKKSTYIYTEALQRTYLIELIHFILKLK